MRFFWLNIAPTAAWILTALAVVLYILYKIWKSVGPTVKYAIQCRAEANLAAQRWSKLSPVIDYVSSDQNNSYTLAPPYIQILVDSLAEESAIQTRRNR